MTTLPPVLLLPEEKESFVEKLRSEHDKNAAFGSIPGSPACPLGGSCECPGTKKLLAAQGILPEDYACQPASPCVVLRILCPNGRYSS